nr:MAG TPA: hypothetical protein [Caudoviricetes sp.]
MAGACDRRLVWRLVVRLSRVVVALRLTIRRRACVWPGSGLCLCHRRTRRAGESGSRVVLSAGCLAWCTGVFE